MQAGQTDLQVPVPEPGMRFVGPTMAIESESEAMEEQVKRRKGWATLEGRSEKKSYFEGAGQCSVAICVYYLLVALPPYRIAFRLF